MARDQTSNFIKEKFKQFLQFLEQMRIRLTKGKLKYLTSDLIIDVDFNFDSRSFPKAIGFPL